MPSDYCDQRPTRPPQLDAPPAEPEHLSCPRCDSTNTKFCYYNNYNFSQPRHFCKSCRRYWTQGGTLRDIPVGGGRRKNAKRCRTATSSTSSAGATQDHRHHRVPSVHDDAPVFLRLSAADHGGSVSYLDDGKPGLNLNMCGSFTSLLSTDDSEAPGTGFGLGPFEDMGISVGRAVWSFPGVGDGGAAGSASAFGNTWQLDGGEGGLMGGGDCFSLPDLAISTHLNILK